MTLALLILAYAIVRIGYSVFTCADEAKREARALVERELRS